MAKVGLVEKVALSGYVGVLMANVYFICTVL